MTRVTSAIPLIPGAGVYYTMNYAVQGDMEQFASQGMYTAAIAGIMAMRPEVLVLDEPAAGLDPQGRDEILGGIRAYREKSDSTVVIVSHSMEDMARWCDEIIVMAHARLLMQGTCDEVFSHPEELAAVGLDVPQITHLAQLLRSRGMPMPESVYTVDQAVAALKKLMGGAKQ